MKIEQEVYGLKGGTKCFDAGELDTEYTEELKINKQKDGTE